MKILRKCGFFALGGGLYGLLEILWRGRTHISMLLLGGGCFLMLGRLHRLSLPVPLKTLLGAAGITAAELTTGLLVNRDFAVWDYRRMPFQFLGQICLPYSLLWIPVALLGMSLYGFLDQKLPLPTQSPR